MQMLSVANCWPPMECRHPETEIGKPFRDAERTISANSSLVCGLRSSRTRVRLNCEWTSLTQISFSRSANTCGASAKSAAASAQPPGNKLGLRIESDVTVPLFFHERKCKLASGSAQAAQYC